MLAYLTSCNLYKYLGSTQAKSPGRPFKLEVSSRYKTCSADLQIDFCGTIYCTVYIFDTYQVYRAPTPASIRVW